MTIRPNPKPAPHKKVRHYRTPRCTFGKGRCKRPQVVFVGENAWCKSHARQEQDRMWSLEVRAKGECEAAGWEYVEPVGRGIEWVAPVVRCGGVLQAAHGFPRTYAKTRHVLLNGFCICAGHHRWFTSHPLEWTQFMIEKLGELPYEELRRLALSA